MEGFCREIKSSVQHEEPDNWEDEVTEEIRSILVGMNQAVDRALVSVYILNL
jgi:hypothetical protein